MSEFIENEEFKDYLVKLSKNYMKEYENLM
jgi:hypothetical protein